MRLTNDIRNQTIKAVLEARIEPRLKQLKTRVSEIAQEAADSYYKPSVREWMRAAPTGAFGTWDQVYLMIGEDHKTRWSHPLLYPDREVPSYFRRKHNLITPIAILEKDRFLDGIELSKSSQNKLRRVEKALNAIQKKEDGIRQTLTTALWSCNTMNQLKERYPDLVKWVPKIERAKETALVLSNEDIVEVIGK